MPAEAPMQRKTIRLPVIPVGVRGAVCRAVYRALALLGRLLVRGLTAGNERRQAVHLFVIRLRRVLLRARLEVLGLRLRLLLFARIERLLLARRERLAAHAGLLIISVVERVVGRIATHLAALLLLMVGLALAKLFLRSGDQTEIMFGVLIIILGGNRITRTLGIAGQLQILLGNVGRRASNFYVLAVGLIHA